MHSQRYRPRLLARSTVLAAGAALLAAAFASIAQPAGAAGGTLTVFAAASLREAFTEIGAAFEKREGVTVRFNFGGSDTLATQIVEGAPADVFASANEKQMSIVQSKGAIVSEPVVFVRNRLTIIVPRDNPAKITSPVDLARKGVRLVLAAPEVPVGRYAREAFDAMSHDPAYGADFVARVNANVVSNETDVKAVATKVALGEADAGVVYTTDVKPIADKVATIAVPAAFSKPAVYPIALVKADGDRALARRFVDYVLSKDGQAALERAGFLPAR
jgi:molybdate transport system substrate-binding protein